MKKSVLIITCVLFITVISALLCAGCSRVQNIAADTSAVTASWFSDVYYWDPPAWSSEDGTVTGDITKKTGLALDISVPHDDGDRRLCLMLVNGNLPDVISVMNEKIINYLVKSGKVWKMEDFLKTYAPDSHLLKDFPEDIKNALKIRDGDWYAFPSDMYSGDNQKTYPPSDLYWNSVHKYADKMTIIWNKALLKRIGITADKLQTEKQVMDAFKKVVDRKIQVDGNLVIPLLIDGVEYQSSSLAALQNFFGAEVIDDYGRYQDRILAPESRHALKFLNTAVRNGYLDTSYFMVDNNQVKEYLASGRVLCFIGNVDNTGINMNEWYSSAPIISSEGTRPVLGVYQQVSCGSISTFISKDCKNPKKIAQWLDYMSSREGMLLSYYGHENIDYNIGSDGLVHVTQQGIKDMKNYSRTGISAWWPFFNQDWYYSVTPKPAFMDNTSAHDQIKCALAKYSQTAVYDSALIHIPVDYINSDSSLVDIDTFVNKYKKSQVTAIIMAHDENEFEEQYKMMIDNLKRLGIEKLDLKKNEIYQMNCKTYNNSIKKVN